MKDIALIISAILGPVCGLASVAIAFRVMRLSTTHRVRLKTISHGFVHDRHGECWELNAQIQCMGLPIKAASLRVVARSVDGFGMVSVYLPCRNSKTSDEIPSADLERGDIAFYALKYPHVAPFKPGNGTFLEEIWPGLNTQLNRKLHLEVYCGEVKVATIWPSRWEWAYSLWNRLAWRLQRLTERRFQHPLSGEPCIDWRFRLPTFKRMISQEVGGFAADVTKSLAERRRIQREKVSGNRSRV